MGSLLSLIKEETNFKLPKDPRTLLKTPTATSIDIKNMAGGQFWYNGVSDLPNAPVFVVALFCGTTKPASAEDYLRQQVAELNRLQSPSARWEEGKNTCTRHHCLHSRTCFHQR